MANGSSQAATTASYSEAAIAELLFMLEEEKVAGDVYDALHDLYGLEVFANIAASEDKHFTALLRQANALGLDVDAILALPSGHFVDPDLQDLHDTLIARGRESAQAALEVGVLIEETDIADLLAASAMVPGTQLATVYGNLLSASYNHLDAFTSALDGLVPPVVDAARLGGTLVVAYADGSTETLEGARLTGPAGVSQATAADHDRLSALVTEHLDRAGIAPETVRFVGDDGADAFAGSGADDDLALGRGGDDVLAGHAGNDILRGNAGDDDLSGGTGRDALHGGTGHDRLTGNGGDDALWGDGGRDRLLGGNGDDMLNGGAHADRLRGGAGQDLLTGGAGRDRLWGGADADTFVITADGRTDIVHDFETGLDLVDISAFDLSGLGALKARAIQSGPDVVVDFGNGDRLRLDAIDLADLGADDFQF